VTSSEPTRQGLVDRIRRQLLAVGAGVAVLVAAALPAQAALSSFSDSIPGFNGTVRATAYLGDTIYVGGDFTAAVVKGKSITRNRLAAIDATTGALLPWAPSANARVRAIAVSGAAIYVAGEFGTINGVKRDNLAKLSATNGAVATTFKHAIAGQPYALAADNGRLYLGGTITKVGTLARTRLAAFNLVSGVLDASWKPTADDAVHAITSAPGRVYVGGKFHKVNGIGGYDRLAALDPATGAIVTGFKPKPPVIAYGVAVTADGVYSAHGGQGGKINAYTTAGVLRWTTAFDGDAQAVTTLGDTVYVGGHFDEACRSPRTGDHGACLDGSDDRVKLAALNAADGHLLDWTANANGVEGVLTMTHHDGLAAVLAGGAFTVVNGKSQKRLAQFR
jgi:hypothetical protein